MAFQLADEQMQQGIEANRIACARHHNFARDDANLDAIVIGHKNGVRAVFDLDKRRSVLLDTFPDLLWTTYDPQQPVVYSPVFREFGMSVFNGGPEFSMIGFDPRIGKPLPAPVLGAYLDAGEEILQYEVGILDDELATLRAGFRGEQWWIERES